MSLSTFDFRRDSTWLHTTTHRRSASHLCKTMNRTANRANNVRYTYTTLLDMHGNEVYNVFFSRPSALCSTPSVMRVSNGDK